MMEISLNNLKYNNAKEEYPSGYRIVYFYNNYYLIGEYSKTIEGFMIGFADCDPILIDEDMPKFISIDDLLNRYLISMINVKKVAIYTTSGECIALKENDINYIK